MCGITGITDKQVEEFEQAIQKMTRCIAHRGPDDDGFFVDSAVALGMRRLAIIDLETGRQPITTADGRYIIFFNGEIYNYKELKRELKDYPYKTESDTEVILAGFLKWGAQELLPRLRGMFAFALYDTVDKKLLLARDHFGIKPLYYWKRGNKIAAFASEVKSILSLTGFKPVVNDEAVYNYLSYQYNPLEETFFKDIFKLSPGHFMMIDLKTQIFEIKRYYQFQFKPERDLKLAQAETEILQVVKDSVAHHMIADVPVGSFLSGGIDSSIIATCMQEARGEKKIKTFTVGFDVLTEAKEAKETSEPLGTDHTEVKVTAEEYFEVLPKVAYHFDEPVADPSAVGIYFLAEEAKKHVKVVLSGEGSDEFFGGYNIYLAPLASHKLSWVPKWVLKILTLIPLRGRNFAERALLRVDEWYIGNASVFKAKELKGLWKGAPIKKYSLDHLYKEASKLSDSAKMQYIDINTWLVGDILAKADKMTMAHSLELRMPFLDKEVAKLASQLPDSLKWHEGETKFALREAFKNLLPESTRKRRKLGFPTPVRAWFTPERKELYDLILENEYVKEHLDTKFISKLIRQHLAEEHDNSRKIYLLLMLSIWYNTFIRK